MVADIAFWVLGLVAVVTGAAVFYVNSMARATGHVRTKPSREIVSKPPTFAPWMSDRLRGVSWFGDEKNQALKAVVFTALEWAKGKKALLTGDTGAEETEEDLGALNANQIPQASLQGCSARLQRDRRSSSPRSAAPSRTRRSIRVRWNP